MFYPSMVHIAWPEYSLILDDPTILKQVHLAEIFTLNKKDK